VHDTVIKQPRPFLVLHPCRSEHHGRVIISPEAAPRRSWRAREVMASHKSRHTCSWSQARRPRLMLGRRHGQARIGMCQGTGRDGSSRAYRGSCTNSTVMHHLDMLCHHLVLLDDVAHLHGPIVVPVGPAWRCLTIASSCCGPSSSPTPCKHGSGDDGGA
jgi:hypothetical protein